MIALFSALLGFVSSAFPDILHLFRESKDRAHEITLLKLQMDYDREKLAAQKESAQVEYAYKLQEIAVQADSAERATLNEGTGTKDGALGIVWVDALSGSVRPILTYCFFTTYILIKLAQFRLLMNPSLPWQSGMTVNEALVALWTPDDMGIFSAIVAFWFGSRALAKFRK
jgi:hypothetical protein